MNYLVSWLRFPKELVIWGLFLVSFPFYFFPSGRPQLSDYLLACAITFSFLSSNRALHPKLRSTLVPIIVFVIWAFTINGAWLIYLPNSPTQSLGLLLTPVFYFYNVSLVWFCFSLFCKFGTKLLYTTSVGIAIGVFLQIVLMPLVWGSSTRNSLFFNNPNQLGYYSLLALTIFLYTDRISKPPAWVKITFFVAATVLAAISLSKAAMVSVVILISINLLETGFVRTRQLIFGILAIVAVFLLSNFTEFGQQVTQQVSDRLSRISVDEDDSFELRGYDRLFNHPEYAIFGAGEGGFERFYDDSYRWYEMHSTFGTILFSYGLIGAFAFLVFLLRAFQHNSLLGISYSVPIFAYGMTHMGLRFSLFWAFFAVVAVTGQVFQSQTNSSNQEYDGY